MSQPGICRSCGAKILWERTMKGVTIPLDPDPRPDGNIVVSEGVALIFSRPDSISERLRGEPRYVAHFTSCPQAAEWRKR